MRRICGVVRFIDMANLFDIRSGTAEAAIKWLRAVADALDFTGLCFKGNPIPISAAAVDAFVYTKRRKPDDRSGTLRDKERADRETSLIDETVAHLYEQPSDWDEREKRRWAQVIQRPGIRLGVRGSPGSGKTFLTRNSVVALARESARLIEERHFQLHEIAVPLWTTGRALSSIAVCRCGDNGRGRGHRVLRRGCSTDGPTNAARAA